VLRIVLTCLCLFLSCHRVTSEGGVDSLVGLSFPLAPSPLLRLVVEGSVHLKPAEVAFDPTQNVSVATSACVESPALISNVKVVDPFGKDQTHALTRLGGLRVGKTLFHVFEAAVVSGESCAVVLGEPELKGLAVEINPATRVVRFRASQSKTAWDVELSQGEEDHQVLPVTREPRYDWPLVPMRLRQASHTLDVAMLLSLREGRSRVFERTARSAGLRPAVELFAGIPLPDGIELPKELGELRGFVVEAADFAPGWGVGPMSVETENGQPPHTAHGVVGADVWGHFMVTLDLGSNVFVLRRPRLTPGPRGQCTRNGQSSEEACFELHTQVTDGGFDVVATVWKPLPQGARLSLDVAGGAETCRVGISFGPGDSGRSTQHHFPWAKLGDGASNCPDAFQGVTAVTPGLMEESALPECPGICAWARDAVSGRLSCACQPSSRGLGEEEQRRLLQLLKKSLESPEPRPEVEPLDPE
jgi:hypothetical protein